MKEKIALVSMLILIAILSCGFYLMVRYFNYSDILRERKFLPKTTVIVSDEEYDVSGLTSDEAYHLYADKYVPGILTVTLYDEEKTIDLSKIFTSAVSDYDFYMLLRQYKFTDYLFFKSKTFQLENEVIYHQDELEKALNQMLAEIEPETTPSISASMQKDESGYFIEKEVYGTELDFPLLVSKIESIGRDKSTSHLVVNEDYYLKPELTEADIEAQYSELLQLIDWTVDYKDSDYVISMAMYQDYIHVDDEGQITVDDSFLQDAVLALSKTIDKAGEEMEFRTYHNELITVSGGTYGQCMDNKAEIEFLKEQLKTRKPIHQREPIWIREPVRENNGLGYTYIEVDIGRQHLWYFVNGEVILESDCVTGDHAQGRDTPTGIYYARNKVAGTWLDGPGWHTWVDRWIGITLDGCGFHDASWRNEFGGDIYLYNGSHGCVNLPSDFAYKLYDEVEVDTPIVIHN